MLSTISFKLLIWKGKFMFIENNAKSRKFLIPFLLIHGLIFLGGGYILSIAEPIITIFHSGLGIFVYIIFLASAFPKIIKDVVFGSVLSIALGLLFGDFLLSNFYPMLSKESLTIFHRIYSMIILFYIYIYIDVLRYFFKKRVYYSQYDRNK